MNKIHIFILVVLGAFLLMNGNCWADVESDSRHPVKGCVKIINSNAFPDVVLVGHLTGMKEELYLVQQGQCLRSGLGSDTAEIFVVDRNSLYAKGTHKFESKAFLNDAAMTRMPIALETTKKSVWAIDPLIAETIEYKVAPQDKSVIVYKSKKISEFNNGKTDNVELFDQP